ncbi:MAG TPA: hypothetical protein VF796_30830 [Humisphaera sp.]
MPEASTNPTPTNGNGPALRPAPPAAGPRGLRTTPGTPNRFVAFGRGWARKHLGRDQVLTFLKNLLWVAPLTILIWVYAERQQLEKMDVTVPIEVVSSDAGRIVRTKESQRTVILTLRGPKAALEGIRDQATPTKPLQIVLDNKFQPGTTQVSTRLVEQDKRLSDVGATVLAANPDNLDVQIDQIVDVPDVPVVADLTLLTPPTFSPAKVTLRGPRSVLKPDATDVRREVRAAIAGRLQANPSAEQVTLNNVALSTGFTDPAVTVVPGSVTATVQPNKPVPGTLDQVRIADVKVPAQFLQGYDVVLPENGNLYGVPISGPKEKVEALVAIKPPGRLPEATVVLPNVDAGGAGEIEAEVHYTLPSDVQVTDAQKKRITVRLVRRAN